MECALYPHLGLIAGRGRYPILLAEAARRQGVTRLDVIAFDGETDPALEKLADSFTRLAVGQLGKLLNLCRNYKISRLIMAGQISPGHLFNLKPDWHALLLLAKLKERNAESIFRAIAERLRQEEVTLLPATTFLEDCLAARGVMAGPPLKKRQHADITYGFRLAKEMARLDVGQAVVVKNGTILAVEAFEGTDACMRRGGPLGRGEAILVKVSKPQQDFRFDVPVLGPQTLRTAHEAGIRVLACEVGKTLLLDLPEIKALAEQLKLTVVGVSPDPSLLVNGSLIADA
jgi:UDP-2,3-diacylglucosamine hydrolase